MCRVNLRIGEVPHFRNYAPQQGRPEAEKEKFYELLQEAIGSYRPDEQLIVMGDYRKIGL